MMKKNSLPATFALLAISALYAFSTAGPWQEDVLTILFPDEIRPVALQYRPTESFGIRSVEADTFPPLKDRFDDFLNSGTNPVDLKDPKAITQTVEYDPVSNSYMLIEKIGDEYYRTPTYMTFEEYLRWRDRQQQQAYFDRLQGVMDPNRKGGEGGDPVAQFDIKNSLIDRLFGGTNVDIKPQGNINLTFGFDYQKIKNPILTLRQQTTGNFDFDMDINMSAQGKIGEKLNLNFNYNTQATFDFDNQMKLKYDTKGFSEDEILQNIEAGNVSFNTRSSLIKGVQNLFGLKTEMKFGHLRTTLVASQQRSKQSTLKVQGGAQVQQFVKPIDEYDENRHFFISHWNRNEFEPAMKCLPVPQSLFNITRMEVWITNDKQETVNTRDVVALSELAEPDSCASQWKLNTPVAVDIKNRGLPANENNKLYSSILDRLEFDPTLRFSDKVVNILTNPADFQMKQIRDFEKVNARQLSPTEFNYDPQLGFLSVNLNVQPDQVLGVALEYTYNGKPYKVGEFSSDVARKNSIDTLKTNVLFVKMLKSTTANVRFPIWDLMMKNVYAVGTANVDPQEFRFDIYYEDPGKGQRRFLAGDDVPTDLRARPLLQVFNLDNLNLQGDPGADGIFDFVPGLTINLRSGRIMFPVLEPFGKFLTNKIISAGADTTIAIKYTYPQLYDSTIFRAREFQQLNRYTLRGSYKSSTSSEISLGTFNLPQGSVRVTAGGQQLREGVDYSVDYNIGKVRILNDAILQSGQSVNVSFEDNTFFGFQSRSMVGARFDYDFSKDFKVGATFMNLFERPLTQKVNFGDDPINNKMYGFDFSISKDAPWLTKLIDKLPLLETKEPSSISAQAEMALLQPGYNKAINQGEDTGGVVYLDDFEGSTANLPLTTQFNQWVISSVPRGDSTLFPEAERSDLALGANRGGLAWYVADPSARDAVDGGDPYTTLIQYQEIFPNRQLTPFEQSSLRPLDVTFYPRERGPYNFELPNGYNGVSAGFTADGTLNLPSTRWAGFMREVTTNDFEAANIEFVEFWILNPYMEKNDGSPVSDAGSMYIDLGSISEDVMRDSRQFFENGLPAGSNNFITDSTTWGRVPIEPPVVNAFDNQEQNRALQDLGLDGLNNDNEKVFFKQWYDIIQSSNLSPNFKTMVADDPSNDDFKYFRDPEFNNNPPGLLMRYRQFNNTEGNSPVNQSNNLNPSATNYPDQEDLNRDRSLNETEAYFRYKIEFPKTLKNGQEVIDEEHPSVRDLIANTVTFTKNGKEYTWYRFKVPLDLRRRRAFGGIQDFRSIRFIRMYWKGFTERTTFRFATLELGRNQWRRFTQALPNTDPNPTGSVCDVGYSQIPFDINAVSIEDNSARLPFNYTIPFGIRREQSVGAFPDILQNEQALAMSVCSLSYCDARAVFKTLNMDLRQYKRMKMFVHAEASDPANFPLDSTDMKVFIRLGSDFVSNYYEYELPLYPSNELNLNGNPDSREYKEEVWRPENQFDFPLDLLVNIKKERNLNPDWPLSTPYISTDPERPTARVKVVGNPNIGYVKGAMIGVRNTDETNNKSNLHCVELWLNELRLSGFNEKGGYAGLARVDIRMADLGNISVAGNYTSIGWGSIEEKLSQRQREEVIQYDISANLELGKFLPEKVGLKLPFYAQYSNITKNPEFDPYDLDIRLKDKLRDETDPIKRDSIRAGAQDVNIIRGYNFTNVRKERKGKPRTLPLPWNIENFSLTYAFNQQRIRTPFILNGEQNQYKGAVDWNYSTGLKPLQPFKSLIKNDKFLKFITDFNFNPLPETYGFSTNLERLASVTTYRFAGEDPQLNTYYNRRFTWDRNYDLGWTISKSIRFNFDATARSLLDEPLQFDQTGREVTQTERNQILWNNFKNLGRPKGYTHNASLSWTLPFKSIPFMDWITMKASYTTGYTWTAQSLKLQNLDAGDFQDRLNERNLGNVIQNNNTRQINGDFNLETLYNKSKYLAMINKPAKSGGKNGSGGKADDLKAPGDDGGGAAPGGGKSGGGKAPGGRGADAGKSAAGGKAPSEKGKDPASDRNKQDDPASNPAKSAAGPAGATGTDGNAALPVRDKAGNAGKAGGGDPKAAGGDPKMQGKITERDDKGGNSDKKKERQPSMAERIALRPLMLVRKARFNYTESFTSMVPGFTPDAKLFGLSEGFAAPGWEFVAGMQPSSEWLDDAGRQGWITHRPELNQQVTRNYTQNFDAGVTIEPFRDFRVEVTANRQYTKNGTELFKDQNFIVHPDSVDYQHRAQRDMGSYTISYFSMQTLFNNDINGLFQRYEQYRPVVSKRLGVTANDLSEHPTDQGFVNGYGRIQQEVLIPAFISAYTESDPNSVNLDIFKTLPSVNWKLNYNGLSKIGNLSKIFSSVQISHGYKNTLTVNSYNTDLFYEPSNPYQIDELNFNYIARYEIPQVVIREDLQPLFGLDVKMKNEMTFKADFKKSRSLAMSFIDYQLAESRSTSYSVGFGYRMKNVNIPFLTGKKKTQAKKKTTKKPDPNAPPTPGSTGGAGGTQANDLNIKFDFEVRDDITINHLLDSPNQAVPTRGARTISINPAVEYALNKRLKLRLFTDYRKTVPKTSQSFPITTLSSGITVQFSLN